MGLSASQVRLLSLTGRQHSIESDAQRIMSNKLRLANESDKVYQNYINSLDETVLKTQQTFKETGGKSWIDASLNNLMRYNTDDNYTGNIFYVQDMSSGKLYLPTEILSNYEHYSDMQSFVESYGVHYTQVDQNEYILTQYRDAIANGWNTEMTEAQYEGYYASAGVNTTYHDIKSYVQTLLNAIPARDSNAIYTVADDTLSDAATTFYNALTNFMAHDGYLTEFNDSQRGIFKAVVSEYERLSKVRLSSEEKLKDEYTFYGKDYKASFLGRTYYETPEDTTYNITAGDSISANGAFEMLLNGGSVTWKETKVYTGAGFIHNVYSNKERTEDMYSQETNIALRKYNNVYQGLNCTNLGQALQQILTNYSGVIETSYLADNGLTKKNLEHYELYREYARLYNSYTPDYVMVPDDKVKAEYYEQMYKAIEAAGGGIELSAEKAKSASWITNMIKSSQVVLNCWDVETDSLTKTSAALHTSLREVTDKTEIERISQEYEADLTIVNEKDRKFDQELEKLDAERSAITSEMESLKKVIQENVDRNFKLFT